MKAHPHRGGLVTAHHPVGDVQPNQDGLRWVRDAQHEGIADGLYLSGVVGQVGSDRVAEVRYKRCCVLVAVRLGQGGEAGDIGEDKGGRRRAQGDPNRVDPSTSSVSVGGVCIGGSVSCSRWLSLTVDVHARDYFDDDDRRGHPVNDQAERRPPTGVGNELAAVLPEILEAVTRQA
jgi:hypothetical protein